MSIKKVFVILPVYNEEQSLPTLIPRILKTMQSSQYPYLIVACDDGSRDHTSQLFNELSKNMNLHMITHKYNRGLGETVRDLMEYAASIADDSDVIVRMDCDDTHGPEFIPFMIKKIEEGYDVVIASRFQSGGGQKGVNAYRAFISYAANCFMKVFFPIKGIREYSCGYRAYSALIIKKAVKFYGNDFIQLKGLGFTCTLEKLIKLNLLGARMTEVAFELRYDQKRSESKMVSSITTLGYIIMAVLYHWPWGGWRRYYNHKIKQLFG